MTKPGMSAFQAEFAEALLARRPSAAAPWLGQPAFAVYRNTVMKGCIDSLEANYPSVARLVGRDWFRSAAALFVAIQPPTDGSLIEYGKTFAIFLRDFEPAAELGYLPEVARLDRFWTESHTAADSTPLRITQLASLAPEALHVCQLQPHPAAHWAWFEGQPIYSIWERNRSGTAPHEDLIWQGEGALLTRPGANVRWQCAGRADCAFLDACAAGRSLGEAAEHAQRADGSADLCAMLGRLLSAGAIADASTQPKEGHS